MGSLGEVYKVPSIEKHTLYAREQEGAQKDVERAFGVLQARFNIVRRPARSWSHRILRTIMKACVILHNMIVEDEGVEMAERPIDLNDAPGGINCSSTGGTSRQSESPML
jgi:hypothetical protein